MFNDRIKKLEPYFSSFNVVASDGAAYILLNLPPKWTVPDESQIKKTFKCETAVRKEGTYFVTEIDNGVENLFDAADYVIDFNKNVEERMELLNEKIKELRELFATETLDKIKTLEFTFVPRIKGIDPKGKKTMKASPIKKKDENHVVEGVEEAPIAEEVKPVAEIAEVHETQNDESSLLEMAKEMIGED